MLITTTANIEGKSIHSYLGIVSGTDIYLVGGVFGGGLANQENLYSAALSNAITKMKQKAANMGANAIVGISTNFTSPGGLNNMIVVVTGTAVIVKDCDTPDSVKANCANLNNHSAVLTVQDTPSNLPSTEANLDSPSEDTSTPHLDPSETPITPEIIDDDNILCPVCGTKQRAQRKLCWSCGQKFSCE